MLFSQIFWSEFDSQEARTVLEWSKTKSVKELGIAILITGLIGLLTEPQIMLAIGGVGYCFYKLKYLFAIETEFVTTVFGTMLEIAVAMALANLVWGVIGTNWFAHSILLLYALLAIHVANTVSIFSEYVNRRSNY